MATEKKGVTAAKLGEWLDMGFARVYQLVKEGVIPPPAEGRFDPIPCFHSYIRHLRKLIENTGSVTLAAERTRLTGLQAQKAELELKIMQGQYIHIDSLNLVDKMILNCKTRLLAIPKKAAPQVLSCNNSLPQIEDKLTEIVYDSLTELAGLDIADLLAVGEDAAVEASAKIKNKRMGRRKKKT